MRPEEEPEQTLACLLLPSRACLSLFSFADLQSSSLSLKEQMSLEPPLELPATGHSAGQPKGLL